MSTKVIASYPAYALLEDARGVFIYEAGGDIRELH